MNVVDSSGWLEYFADGPNAGFFAPPILDRAKLIVPSLSLHEVFERVLQQRDEGAALQAVVEDPAGAALPGCNPCLSGCSLQIPVAPAAWSGTEARPIR